MSTPHPQHLQDVTRLDPRSGDDYRRVLGRVPTSVAVIASTIDGEPVGVSVGSLTSVSLDPPLVGFYIAQSSSTWPLIEPTGGFCASVLAASHEDLCRLFATPGADRFRSHSYHLSPAGRPIIKGAVAWIDCAIHSVQPAGDHVLVLGEIEAMDHTSESPLVFLGGRYGRVAELNPEGATPD